MNHRFAFLFVLVAFLAAAPALYASEAPADLQQALVAPSVAAAPQAMEAAADCPDATAAKAPDFNTFDASLKSAGKPDAAVCDYQTRTSYVCNCNLAGGTRYRKIVEDRCCYPWGCTSWQVATSSCTNYPC
ncbi:MAG: hypothetical protein KDD47_27745 [Acidobacteria bacterium]|nr:hypothetical protein [Acidobacteriota bacterium]